MTIPRIHQLTEAEFEGSDVSQCLFAQEHARRFGCIQLPHSEKRVVFSWRSDLLDPCVLFDSNTDVTWIGVDERVGAIRSDGVILCSIELDTPLQTILGFQGGVVVVCELAAIICDDRGNELRSIDFPDVALESAVRGNQLDVHFVDGNDLEFSLTS